MGSHASHCAADRSLSSDQWRIVLFVAVLAVYIAFTLCIVFRTPLLNFDTYLADQHMRGRFPGWRPWIFFYVMLGQRGPATLLFLPYFLWTCWRRRSTQPIVLLGTALVVLNLSVGVVKYAIGRLGPRDHGAAAHDLFAGGSIYPSGHVSNAVVLYGLIAMLVLHHRKIAAGIAAFVSFTVGLGTIYLDTHWFSDVVGGWLAGSLVLLALPWVMPYTQAWADAVVRRLRALWDRHAIRAAAPAMPPRVANSYPAAAGKMPTGEPNGATRKSPITSGQ
ncbi:MAG TPA: phosphatase PAP2 family protein [Jatrophihabitans sp.]|nr:phosphatase PAP2 family protein [Jatrophihabitans sp.]